MTRIDERVKDRIFVALDYDNMEDAKRLVEKLGENGYKNYKLWIFFRFISKNETILTKTL